MKCLVGLLLVMGMVGCGGDREPTTLRIENARPTTPPEQHLDEEPLIALDLLDARITKDHQSPVTDVNLGKSQITDAGLVHLKGMTKLKLLGVRNIQITHADVAELQNLEVERCSPFAAHALRGRQTPTTLIWP